MGVLRWAVVAALLPFASLPLVAQGKEEEAAERMLARAMEAVEQGKYKAADPVYKRKRETAVNGLLKAGYPLSLLESLHPVLMAYDERMPKLTRTMVDRTVS